MAVVPVRFHETRKCPPGSLAWHADLGLVDVLETRGWDRIVRVGRPATPADGPDHRTVDVRELELIDADPAFGAGFALPLAAADLRALVEADDGELAEARAWELGARRAAE